MYGFPEYREDIIAVEEAISKAPTEIIYSLSPGSQSTPEEGQDIGPHANTYRITDDLWDCWEKSPNSSVQICRNSGTYPATLRGAFDTLPRFTGLIHGNGLDGYSWPDGDMLPIGVISDPTSTRVAWRNTSFTKDEQYSLITLWSIFRNPLMIGGDLTQMDTFTYNLLTNKEVIEINQKSVGNEQLWADKVSNIRAWKANRSDSSIYVALFNIGETTSSFRFDFSDVKLTGTCQVRDVWKQGELGPVKDGFETSVASHGVQLYNIHDCK